MEEREETIHSSELPCSDILLRRRLSVYFYEMAVSTIFLQTTNEGENEYGDTTFAIHVPAKDKSYKLSVASFMFRPKFIIMDTNEYMTLQLSIRRNYPNTYPNSYLDATFFYPLTVDIRIAVPQDVNFNPSKLTCLTCNNHSIPSSLFKSSAERTATV